MLMNQAPPIRMLADDHPIVLQGLSADRGEGENEKSLPSQYKMTVGAGLAIDPQHQAWYNNTKKPAKAG